MTMTPPYRRHAPSASVIPLVFDSPHSGEDYPGDFDHAPPRADVRRAEDTHIARLYACAPRHGATLLEALFPARVYRPQPQRRLYMDESTLAPHGGYAKLERDLERLVAALAAFVRAGLR
jgi:N-formylglutamate amidohydrolase